MVDHPNLDETTVGVEQTAAGERGAASRERRAAATGPPLLAVVESGPTPAVFLARRTSLTKLSRRPRLPMRPIRISTSLVAAHGGVSGISVWLVPKRTLRNRAFCLRVALPTDRRPAESQAVPTAWRRMGASLLSCHSAVGIPQPPITRIH
jgi:hypothetical protein